MDEIERLQSEGPTVGDPSGLLIEVSLRAAEDVDDVLTRIREVLLAVLAADDWPEPGTWDHVLPGWFVARCAPEQTEEEAQAWLTWWRSLDPMAQREAEVSRGWSLSDWLHWLEPENRVWFWWDGQRGEGTTATVRLLTEGWPVALGAFTWLATSAGGEVIDVVPQPPGSAEG